VNKEERDLIEYRIQRAYEALDEAAILYESGHLNTYVNRLYYASFYAVYALLLTQNISTSKHTHLRSLLHREYVKTGIIPPEMGRHFDLLFDSRQESDYADFVTFNCTEVEAWKKKTESFVNHVDKLIKSHIDNA
jgi:uncharacterized protein (UPF0332 family)